MTKFAVVASSVEVFDDDPDVLGVCFRCEELGPYCYIALERAYRPAPGNERYAADQVSLDLNLRPWANLGCSPGVVSSIRMSPRLIALELCKELDPEMGDVRAIDINLGEEASLGERMRNVLQMLFDGTSVAPEMPA